MSNLLQHQEETPEPSEPRSIPALPSGETGQGRISRTSTGLTRESERSTRKGRTASKISRASMHSRSDRKPSTTTPDEPRWFKLPFRAFFSQSPNEVDIHTNKLPAEQRPRVAQYDTVDLEGFFQQAAQDSHIYGLVSSLKQNIENHVDNFYRGIKEPLSTEDFLIAVSLDDEEIHTCAPFLNHEPLRLAAIQRTIAQSAIDKIRLNGDPETTFLPKEIVSLLAMVPKHHSDRFQTVATALFRRTAANLLRLHRPGECGFFMDFQTEQVRAASKGLSSRLEPLANPDCNDLERETQLEAIIGRFAELGVLLLLQPATYEFKGSSPLRPKYLSTDSFPNHAKAKARCEWRFTSFPALLRTGDSTGQPLRRAETVCRSDYVEGDDIMDEMMDGALMKRM